MSCWSTEQLENMLEDVVNELDLSDTAIVQHGPHGTAPAELVRLALVRLQDRICQLESRPAVPEEINRLVRKWRVEAGTATASEHGFNGPSKIMKERLGRATELAAAIAKVEDERGG